jgi:hypothetical protein
MLPGNQGFARAAALPRSCPRVPALIRASPSRLDPKATSKSPAESNFRYLVLRDIPKQALFSY